MRDTLRSAAGARVRSGADPLERLVDGGGRVGLHRHERKTELPGHEAQPGERVLHRRGVRLEKERAEERRELPVDRFRLAGTARRGMACIALSSAGTT